MLAATEFADWVLGIVGATVATGGGALLWFVIKTASGQAVITAKLDHIKAAVDKTEVRGDALETEVREMKATQKRHSDRIRDLESKPDLKPRRA